MVVAGFLTTTSWTGRAFRVPSPLEKNAPPGGLSSCAGLVGTKICVCDQFQPCTSAQTDTTPDLTLTLTLILTRTPTLWGARRRQGQGQPGGSAACVGGVVPRGGSTFNKSDDVAAHDVCCVMDAHVCNTVCIL